MALDRILPKFSTLPERRFLRCIRCGKILTKDAEPDRLEHKAGAVGFLHSVFRFTPDSDLCADTLDRQPGGTTRLVRAAPHDFSSSSKALASFKSSVSKPSVNQP
jgi:hypothetical protein